MLSDCADYDTSFPQRADHGEVADMDQLIVRALFQQVAENSLCAFVFFRVQCLMRWPRGSLITCLEKRWAAAPKCEMLSTHVYLEHQHCAIPAHIQFSCMPFGLYRGSDRMTAQPKIVYGC